MPKWFKTSALTVACVTAGFIVGYVSMGSRLQKIMCEQNAGLVSKDVALLAHLRAGDTDYCIEMIESNIDNRVRQAAMLPDNSLPKRESLQLVRVYVDAVPDVPLSEEGREILNHTTPLERQYCSPALQALQSAAQSSDPKH